MPTERQIKTQIEALGVPREKRSALWEARAKLIWGSDAKEVQRDLEISGIDAQTVGAFMSICLGERGQAMRGKGRMDLAVGGALAAMGIVGAIAVWQGVAWLQQQIDVPAKLPGVLWGLCAVAAVYGVFRLLRGVERVLFGAKAEGAVDDMDE